MWNRPQETLFPRRAEGPQHPTNGPYHEQVQFAAPQGRPTDNDEQVMSAQGGSAAAAATSLQQRRDYPGATVFNLEQGDHQLDDIEQVEQRTFEDLLLLLDTDNRQQEVMEETRTMVNGDVIKRMRWVTTPLPKIQNAQTEDISNTVHEISELQMLMHSRQSFSCECNVQL